MVGVAEFSRRSRLSPIAYNGRLGTGPVIIAQKAREAGPQAKRFLSASNRKDHFQMGPPRTGAGVSVEIGATNFSQGKPWAFISASKYKRFRKPCWARIFPKYERLARGRTNRLRAGLA